MKKKSIDIASIVGLILAFGLIVFGIVMGEDENGNTAILMENMSRFVDVNSILIVIGGTIAALLVMFPLGQVLKMPKHLMIIIMPRQFAPEIYIEAIVEAAKKARLSGLLSLEDDIAQMENAFMKTSLQMVVDSVDPEDVKTQMESWLDGIEERHIQDSAFYDKGAALAPGFGMIGTLIGLVNLMQQLDDPSSVGPAMAVALITTFYGSVLANVVFLPIANKLRVRHDEEYLCMQIISVGVEAIQEGQNPNVIQERLLNMLPEYKRTKASKKAGDAKSE